MLFTFAMVSWLGNHGEAPLSIVRAINLIIITFQIKMNPVTCNIVSCQEKLTEEIGMVNSENCSVPDFLLGKFRAAQIT